MSHPPPVTLQVLDWSIPVLRLAQSVSACSFSVFSVIHLSAPLTALLPSRPKYLSSPENRANGFLLIGRELYQGEWSEPILVYGSLAVHVVSGVVNRWLKVLQTTERRKWKRHQLHLEMKDFTSLDNNDVSRLLPEVDQGEKEMLVDELDYLEAQLTEPSTASGPEDDIVVPSSSTSIFPPLTTHHKTGYALLPIVLHHLYVQRILPSTPAPPISSLSPSFFNYTFTALSLTHSSLYLRVASTVSYASLASIATYHALVGLRILSDPTAPRSLGPKRPRAGRPMSRRRKLTGGREWQAVWTALVVGLGVGTARIAGGFGAERIGTNPEWIAKRMDYVLRKGWGAV